MTIAQARGGDDDDEEDEDEDQCHNITTTFDIKSEFIYINNSIIGIPNGTEVEIECRCLGPRRRSAEWSFNDNEINTARNENDPSSPYIETDGPAHIFLKIDSFEEKSMGVYTCHSRDRTDNFNLTWYNPGKFGTS